MGMMRLVGGGGAVILLFFPLLHSLAKPTHSELRADTLATVGPMSHIFASGDIKPTPSVAVYSIIGLGLNASSEQWKSQSPQGPSWVLRDG